MFWSRLAQWVATFFLEKVWTALVDYARRKKNADRAQAEADLVNEIVRKIYALEDEIEKSPEKKPELEKQIRRLEDDLRKATRRQSMDN